MMMSGIDVLQVRSSTHEPAAPTVRMVGRRRLRYNEFLPSGPAVSSMPAPVKSKNVPLADVPEVLVHQPAELAACVAQLTACKRFGFDTEFVGENSYHPHLCLVQVATAEALYLIDPLTVGPLDAFWRAVVDPGHEVVVHAGREEIRLCQLACGQAPVNLIDLQLAAGLAGLTYPLGHGPLVQQVLGIQLSKGETLTEWGKRPLTRAQIRYAFDDVRFLLAVWERLSQRLEARGRHGWLREEMARLIASATPSAPADVGNSDKWRKLRGAGSLDRRRLAVLRELFTWREEAAARSNRPTRAIVRDDLLVEIARRLPAKEKDLHVVRGLPRRDLEAVMQAVERGRALPPEQCPPPAERDQDPPQVGMVVGILQAVLGDSCARQHLAANLVASSHDVKQLVRAHMQGGALPDDSLLTRGWRAEHVLPMLLDVLHGRRQVRVANIRADAPLELCDSH
jgi:ribonuclease D